MLGSLVGASVAFGTGAHAADPAYEPTDESLARHKAAQWYDDAKLGIMLTWGLYSVPGWASLAHQDNNLLDYDYFKNDPYAEWYINVLKIDGSPGQQYHRSTYGEKFDYYDFAPMFNRAIEGFDPDVMARAIQSSGAKYSSLVTKHHDGFCLWPTKTPNPRLSGARLHANRDIVSLLQKSCLRHDIEFGLYYSGGLDWTFKPGPATSVQAVYDMVPQTEDYGRYVRAHYGELMDNYAPPMLWNDIDCPKPAHAREIEAEYYNRFPRGVINDRWGIPHCDFATPEYKKLPDISPTKWEMVRGVGHSFGYNRNEGAAQMTSAHDLVWMLSDVVSKNGNLHLGVGPKADGSISDLQMAPLLGLGSWLKINGEAIYGTRPWVRAEGRTSDNVEVRFTTKGKALYAIVNASPKDKSVQIKIQTNKPLKATLLGSNVVLECQQTAESLRVKLPDVSAPIDVYTLKLEGV